MEAGRVVIFEDDAAFCNAAADAIQADDSPHKVIAAIDNLSLVWATLDLIEAGKLDCNIIVLDDNLTPGAPDGQDGRMIAETIRYKDLPVKIFGYSLGKMSTYGVPVDIDVGKENVQTLRGVIDELLGLATLVEQTVGGHGDVQAVETKVFDELVRLA